jgi:flagellar hook-basal body complex protein FliE
MSSSNGLTKIGDIVSRDTTKSLQQNTNSNTDFESVLKNTIGEQNELMVESEKAMVDLSTGQLKDIHQAAIAINKAETSLKLVLEVRNKAISAYKEILRTQM